MVVLSVISKNISLMTEEIMNWIFIITRDNVVEGCKIFTDYFEGEQFANNFIKKIHPSTTDFPEYRKGLFYENEGLRVSLYKDGFGDWIPWVAQI